MAVIGVDLEPDELVLQRGRDFRWIFRNLNEETNVAEAFPAGTLYFEFDTDPVITWAFSIDGDEAFIKVESEAIENIPNRCRWQLVFRPAGEPAGGDPIALGTVRLQP